MKISELSVNRPVTTAVIFLAVIVLGIFSLSRLAIDLIPDISFPMIAIFSDYPGVGPEEVEENLTKIIENAAAAASNVKKITSTSREGQASIMVEYEWGTDMGEAAATLREKLDLVRDFLPDEASQPVIFKFDPSMIPIMVLVVEGRRDLKSLRYIAENDIKNNFERIDGVANVEIWGGLQRQVHVDLDRTALASYGLTVDQVINIIRGEHLNIAGGSIDEGNSTLSLRTVGKFQSLEEIENLIIASNSGVPVYLRDLSRVYDGFVEEKMDAKIGRNDAIILVVQKQSGTNTVQIARLVERRIKSLDKFLPPDISIEKFYSPADFIKESISNVWQIALIGGVFAIFVLFIFLRNLPTTLIISVSIPLSIITTFVFMYLFDLSINMMSLGGLALGIGMLVDNSIVVLENIFRYREFGAKPAEASKLGSQEMANAIVASTLTTITVFLPLVFFIKGLASELFRDLAFTVTFSLLASLLVALTIIPMLSSKIKKVELRSKAGSLRDMEKELQSRGGVLRLLDNMYKDVLEWALSHRWIFVGLVLLVLGGSIVSMKALGVEFMPQSDEGFIQIRLNTPVGTNIDTTRAAVDNVYDIVAENVPERDITFVQVGRSGDMQSIISTNRAEIWMTLTNKEERDRSDKDIIAVLRKEIASVPGVEAEFSTGGGGPGGGGGNLSVIITGYNLKQGMELAGKLKLIMEDVKSVQDVRISREEGLPELRVKLDRDRASFFGVNVAAVGYAIKRAFTGEDVANVILTGEEVGVLVRLQEKDRMTVDDLELISVATPFGKQVLLSNFTELEKGYGPVTVERERQQRVVYVHAKVEGDVKGAVDAIKKEVDKLVLPAGFSVHYGGSWEDFQETIMDLVLVMILAIILIYLIMSALFESFLDPFIIMFTLPMTFIGVVWMHLITGDTFSAMAGIGVVMLAGIVVNNGIILVDYINLLRKRGYDLLDAVKLAGRARLRPILMTMLTTVLGLVPMALAIGSGSELRAPMARTVIGGLLVSTIFTLVFIPVLYTMFETGKQKRKEKRLRKEAANG
ncbi:MAG TPA: efflux RND transporter permease subunit [Spirochaetes bacterium]|nr:efflux RND transporter permease subunit [Spirochaetota bacterium]